MTNKYPTQYTFLLGQKATILYIRKNQTLKASMHTLLFTGSELRNMANISYLENPLESEDLYESYANLFVTGSRTNFLTLPSHKN